MDIKTILITIMLLSTTMFVIQPLYTDTVVKASSGSDTTVTGLTFEGLTDTWHDNGVTLSNSYVNITLTPKQLFVPDILDDLNTNCVYNFDTWHGNQAWMHITLTYQASYCGWDGNPQLYPHVDLDTILGGSQWTTSEYPANWFNVGPIQTIASGMDDDRFVFEVDPITSGTATWRINVTSHYQYVIIDYELWYNNETLVYTFQDVYIGGTPDLLAINYQINKYRDPGLNTIVDRALISYDNLYGENKTVNITIAYPETKSILEMSHDDTEISSQYSDVVTKATDLGRTETLLDSTDGYTIRSYLVDIPENTKEAIYFKIPSAYGEYNNLSMWITGSYAGGNGTSGNPYQIGNWTHLASVNDNTSESFILMNDLNSTTDGYNTYASNTANGGDGWKELGNFSDDFSGTFDGQNYTISDLFMDRSGGRKGFFGETTSSAVISNVGLLDIDITGGYYVGGLVGLNDAEIDNCYTTGCVETTDEFGYTGGFVGYQKGTITNSYSTADVQGQSRIGGFIGIGSNINNCYSTGDVTMVEIDNRFSTWGGGGFIGIGCNINNCYSTGDVTTEVSDSSVGGFVGRSSGYITNSYSTGAVIYSHTTNPTNRGFSAEVSTGEINNCFWDNITSAQTTSDGTATGHNTTNMQLFSTFDNAGWDIVLKDNWNNEVWYIDNGSDYPRLWFEFFPEIDNPYPSDEGMITELQPVCSIDVSHGGGAEMDVTFATNESGSWTNMQTNSSVTEGTYTWDFTDADTYHTTYYWRVYADDGNRNESETYSFIINTIPNVYNETVTPTEGTEDDTNYEFNVTVSDTDWTAGNTLDVYVDVEGTNDYNLSMSYVSGDNTTGAYFNLSRTFPSIGIYTATFLVYDGYIWNETAIVGFSVGVNLSFNINFPVFLEVGDYLQSWGTIRNTTAAIDSVWVTTKIIDSDWNTVNLSEMEYYITNGAYYYSFSTSTIEPGQYNIIVNYTCEAALDHSTNWTLYLSDYSGPGHIATNAFFSFYDNNTGVGINPLSFKIYADNELPLTDSDRIYDNTYPNTYTGETLYYRIDDYFDNTIIEQDSVTISEIDQFVDLPIDWNSFSVKNMNNSIIKFTIENGSRSYSQYLYPYEPFYWNVLDGEYNITMDYYTAATSAYEETVTDTITITDDTYYWIQGYDLRDIIVEINAVNTTVGNLSMNITSSVNITNSSIDSITTAITSNLTATETNITNLINSYSSNYTIIESYVANLDNNIWSNLTVIDSVVDMINNKINIDLSSLNSNITNLNNNIWANLSFINATIDTINNNVDMKISTINSSIGSVETNIKSQINISESNITNLTSEFWASFNITTSMIEYLNSTIWNEFSFMNSTINTINNNIWTNLTAIQTDVGSINTSIISTIDLMESNLTSYNQNIWSAINATDSILSHINNTIWTDISAINSTIDTVNNKLSIDFDMLNTNISNLNNNIWSNFSAIESTVGTIETNIISSLELTESNLSSLSNNIWNSINMTDSMVSHINNTLWGEIDAIDVSIDDLENTMQANFTMLNSSMNNVSVNISGEVNINDSTITNMLANMWGNINVTESNLSYLNTTIWGEFSITNNNINNTQITLSGIWNDQNNSFNNLENLSTVIFNFYNTNQGLGLDRETLKVYINGSRLVGNVYYCNNASDKINVTVKDYYNSTLYQNNFTVNSTYSFLDLGLTFHSWLFGNNNEEYYMISLRKENASRWWERGIVPSGEREFMIPSGNYSMRIYDGSYEEIYNSSDEGGNITINNSRVYVIEGTNLSEIISGQSVIRGQLLELNSALNYALTPDVVTICSNPPMVKAMHSADGRMIADGVFLICPALVVTAETRQIDTDDNISSTALVPSNGSVSNGTITILKDTLYFEGSSSTSYVNVTYANNGTVLQNTSYIPNKLDLYGENVTINASNDITVKRETKYHQYKKFDWTWYSYENKYETAIEIINPMNTSVYDVDVLIEFANGSHPDVDAVTVRDVNNDDVLLEAGKNFKITDTGIEFSLLSMNASSTRRFQCKYFSRTEEQYTFGIKHTSVETYDYAKGGGIYESDAQWIYNDDTGKVFNGILYIDMNFDGAEDIKASSVKVFDDNNNKELSRGAGDFMVMGSTVVISESGLGEVSPGASKHFTLQFLMNEEDGEIANFNLKSVLFYLGGFPITVWLVGVIIALLIIAVAFFYVIYSKQQKPTWADWSTFLKIAAIPTLVMFMLFIFMIKG